MIHVDDPLIGGNEDSCAFRQAIQHIRSDFKWGIWEEKAYVQCGLEYVHHVDFSIEIKACEATTRIKEMTYRRCKLRPLTDEEKTQFRATLGALQWISAQVLFRLAGEVSLLQGKMVSGDTDTIIGVNKLVRRAHATCNQGIYIRRSLVKCVSSVGVAALGLLDTTAKARGHIYIYIYIVCRMPQLM